MITGHSIKTMTTVTHTRMMKETNPRLRYYTGSIDEIFEPINVLGWKQLNESTNLSDNIYLY